MYLPLPIQASCTVGSISFRLELRYSVKSPLPVILIIIGKLNVRIFEIIFLCVSLSSLDALPQECTTRIAVQPMYKVFLPLASCTISAKLNLGVKFGTDVE